MSRLRSAGLLVIMVAVGAIVFAGRLAPTSLAQTPADRSEVVLVFDFSASILVDVANRNRFAAALDRIADRVDATSADLVAGDAAMSIVEFATRADDYTGCVDLEVLESPQAVARFADCLRSVAKAYRKGLDPALTSRIGIDTNYMAAMEQAARHLPADAIRQALILLTDGKHDVPGVPVSEVLPTRDSLFGGRSPFALLPVGMGLIPAERSALETGLLKLRIIRDMPACISGARFDWPQVVFESADDAGNAVAVALQDVTCTFTVAPSPTSPALAPTPVPTPGATAAPASVTPPETPAAPGKPVVEALNGAVRIAVPAEGAPLVSDYRYECSGDQGRTWAFGIDVPAAGTTTAEIGKLTNGVEYVCRAFAANAAGVSDPSGLSDAVRPCGSLLECNPGATPILGILGFVGLGGLMAALFALYRSRTQGYVVAVVDVVHTANLGVGSRLGIGFVRERPAGPVTGIMADRSRGAEVRIRLRRGDRFEVTDRSGRHVALSGERFLTVDSRGVQHAVVLRRFHSSTASSVASHR